MAHGYAKAAGKPMLVVVHGTVGLLHSSMALFQAWADRVPVVVIVGHHRNPSGVINRPHSAQDMGLLVRSFVKFDDEATTLERFAESAMRAYRDRDDAADGTGRAHGRRGTAGVDRHRTSRAFPELVDAGAAAGRCRRRARSGAPARQRRDPADSDRQAGTHAEGLGPAHRAGRDAAGAGRRHGLLVVAEVPVVASALRNRRPRLHAGRDARPRGHRHVGAGARARERTVARRSASRRSICSRAATSTTSGATADVDLAIAADAEATLPSLIEEVRTQTTPERKSAIQARGARVAAAHKEPQLNGIRDARHGWDASPVSVPRLIAELGDQIANDDWAIVSGHQFTGDWQRRLLNHDKPYRYNGDCGGFGIGYDTPASVGGALAHKKVGRLSVAIVGDGDLNFSPGVLWTAAHHKIPLLFVVHNNRAYHAEVMIIQRMCGVRGRGNENAHIGNVITDPEHQLRADGKGVRDVQRGTDREPEGSGGSVSAGAREGESRRAGAHRRDFAAAVIT